MNKLLCSALLLGILTHASAASDSNNAPPPAPAVTSASASNDDTGRLWIAVHLPSGTSPAWVNDDLAATFADTVANALRNEGYKGKIGTLRPEISVSSRTSVLVVRLTEWSTNDGVASCTFTASLRTRDGDHELGIFTGDNLVVTPDGEHRISSDGLQGSAQEAMSDLLSRIQETGLVASR